MLKAWNSIPLFLRYLVSPRPVPRELTTSDENSPTKARLIAMGVLQLDGEVIVGNRQSRQTSPSAPTARS